MTLDQFLTGLLWFSLCLKCNGINGSPLPRKQAENQLSHPLKPDDLFIFCHQCELHIQHCYRLSL